MKPAAGSEMVSISLADAPRVLQVAIGIHGDFPVENYGILGFWCLHFFTYSARLRLDDRWYEIRPGYVSLIPRNREVEIHYRGRSIHTFAHFQPPSEDAAGDRFSLPLMMDAGPDFDRLEKALREAVAWAAVTPRRAEARLWDILWELGQLASSQDDGPATGRTPSVRLQVVSRAMQLIETTLSQPLSVPDLAAAVGVSHNHLTRLFQRDVGQTVVGYVRSRRVLRAVHLLQNTSLPIKAIASQVGIGDLHLFNKTIRGATGKSPRGVRKLNLLPLPPGEIR
jgi:AraC-like DNA-binding protein